MGNVNSDVADDFDDDFDAADDDGDDRQSMHSQDSQSRFSSTSDTTYEMSAGPSQNRESRISSVSAPDAPLAEKSPRQYLRDIAEIREETLQKCNPTAIAVQESFCKVLSRKFWIRYYLVLTASYMLHFRAAKLVRGTFHNFRTRSHYSPLTSRYSSL